jgi:TetR/AcrR family transcriptional repressor of nem operon
MAKKKGQKSREKIIEIALTQIYQKGYSDTSAQEIADLAGVSQANIFYHFKNKRKLFQETLNYVIQNNRNIFAKMIDENLGAKERLRTLVLANIKWAVSYPEQTNIILILFNFATFDTEFKEIAEQTMLGGRRLIVEILKELELNSELDIDELAVMIQQYANGAMFQILASTHPLIVAKRFENSIDHFLKDIL